jgi:hypothetical protein
VADGAAAPLAELGNGSAPVLNKNEDMRLISGQ